MVSDDERAFNERLMEIFDGACNDAVLLADEWDQCPACTLQKANLILVFNYMRLKHNEGEAAVGHVVGHA